MLTTMIHILTDYDGNNYGGTTYDTTERVKPSLSDRLVAFVCVQGLCSVCMRATPLTFVQSRVFEP